MDGPTNRTCAFYRLKSWGVTMCVYNVCGSGVGCLVSTGVVWRSVMGTHLAASRLRKALGFSRRSPKIICDCSMVDSSEIQCRQRGSGARHKNDCFGFIDPTAWMMKELLLPSTSSKLILFTWNDHYNTPIHIWPITKLLSYESKWK